MQTIKHTLVIVLVVTFVGVASANVLGDICATPDGMNGICTILTSCNPLLTMVRAVPQPPATKRFLIDSQCTKKRINQKPVVCCPNDPPTRFNSESLINADNCGFSAVSRIFGGDIAAFEQFPWLVILKYKTKQGQYEFLCGGSLISDRYVLTAAHCITEDLVAVHLGEHDLTTDPDCYKSPVTNKDVCTRPVQIINIEKKIKHSEYSRTTLVNDIALLRLAKSANLTTAAVQPVCLPTREDLQKTPGKLTVAGWGRSENAINGSDVLQFVQVPVVPQAECSQVKEYRPFISNNTLCAGGTNKKDSCNGDSGGPLFALRVVNDTSKYMQFGVVSFGITECGKEGYPGVYTRITSYMDWILNNIKP